MPTLMPSVHMPSMPLRRKRKTRAQRVLETTQSAMKVYTSMKVAQAGPKAAKQVAKGYVAAKGAKGGAKGVAKVAKFAVIPAGAAGGYVVYKKMSGGEHDGHSSPSYTYSSPETPAEPPVSTGAGAPRMGEPGAPKSGTSTASPPPSSTPGGSADAGGAPAS